MMAGPDAGLLEFLQEPVFMLAASGEILRANAAARRLSSGDPAGRNISEFLSSPSADFRKWLRLCSGTTAPVVGSLTFRRKGGGTVKLRTYGARLPGGDVAVRIGLRCVTSGADGFSVLARKLDELNEEIRRRRRAQAVLEETLAENRLLLGELHHRAKNNIQLMYGLLSAAVRSTSSPEARRILGVASQRLLAIGAAQKLLYQSQRIGTIPAAVFIERLCDALSAMLGPDVRLEVKGDDGELANDAAFPLALILNELLTNAFKHGLKEGGGWIRVGLQGCESDYLLTVHDSGPGFDSNDLSHRSSGLDLVRGLCRQLGGRLTAENAGGARITVAFPRQA